MQERIKAFIESNRETTISNLRALVGINTFSRNKAGNDRSQRTIRSYMPAGYTVDIHRQEEVGDHYVYTYPCCGPRPIALHGHVDTLCPEDPTFDSADLRDERIYGPGVHDMKGGLVTSIWSLKALDHLGLLDQMSFIAIFNADEELGSNSLVRHADIREGNVGFPSGYVCPCVYNGRRGEVDVRLFVTQADLWSG